jgi:hypothetical protein
MTSTQANLIINWLVVIFGVLAILTLTVCVLTVGFGVDVGGADREAGAPGAARFADLVVNGDVGVVLVHLEVVEGEEARHRRRVHSDLAAAAASLAALGIFRPLSLMARRAIVTRWWRGVPSLEKTPWKSWVRNSG